MVVVDAHNLLETRTDVPFGSVEYRLSLTNSTPVGILLGLVRHRQFSEFRRFNYNLIGWKNSSEGRVSRENITAMSNSCLMWISWKYINVGWNKDELKEKLDCPWKLLNRTRHHRVGMVLGSRCHQKPIKFGTCATRCDRFSSWKTWKWKEDPCSRTIPQPTIHFLEIYWWEFLKSSLIVW